MQLEQFAVERRWRITIDVLAQQTSHIVDWCYKKFTLLEFVKKMKPTVDMSAELECLRVVCDVVKKIACTHELITVGTTTITPHLSVAMASADRRHSAIVAVRRAG